MSRFDPYSFLLPCLRSYLLLGSPEHASLHWGSLHLRLVLSRQYCSSLICCVLELILIPTFPQGSPKYIDFFVLNISSSNSFSSNVSFYMTGFYCKVTSGSTMYRISTPKDPANCLNDSSACVSGLKNHYSKFYVSFFSFAVIEIP